MDNSFDQQQPSQFSQQNAYGAPVPANSQYNAPAQQWGYQGYGVGMKQKSRLATVLLCLFLGGFGAHNFYLGYTGKGIAQLALTIFSIFTFAFVIGLIVEFFVAIWVIIELIMIVISSGSYKTDMRGIPLS